MKMKCRKKRLKAEIWNSIQIGSDGALTTSYHHKKVIARIVDQDLIYVNAIFAEKIKSSELLLYRLWGLCLGWPVWGRRYKKRHRITKWGWE